MTPSSSPSVVSHVTSSIPSLIHTPPTTTTTTSSPQPTLIIGGKGINGEKGKCKKVKEKGSKIDANCTARNECNGIPSEANELDIQFSVIKDDDDDNNDTTTIDMMTSLNELFCNRKNRRKLEMIDDNTTTSRDGGIEIYSLYVSLLMKEDIGNVVL